MHLFSLIWLSHFRSVYTVWIFCSSSSSMACLYEVNVQVDEEAMADFTAFLVDIHVPQMLQIAGFQSKYAHHRVGSELEQETHVSLLSHLPGPRIYPFLLLSSSTRILQLPQDACITCPEKESTTTAGRTPITCIYTVASRELIQRYFDNEAAEMRADTLSRCVMCEWCL